MGKKPSAGRKTAQEIDIGRRTGEQKRTSAKRKARAQGPGLSESRGAGPPTLMSGPANVDALPKSGRAPPRHPDADRRREPPTIADHPRRTASKQRPTANLATSTQHRMDAISALPPPRPH